MNHDDIGIMLGMIVVVMLVSVFCLFIKDFNRYAKCPITEFYGYFGIIVILAFVVMLFKSIVFA